MSNKEILFKNLDMILRKTFRYSLILGSWGKYVWITIYPGYDKGDGYSARSYVVKPSRIDELERQKVCNSCYEDVYVSEHDPTTKTNNYSIYINENIGTIKKNSKEIKKLIRDIEILSIDAYNIVRDLYLYPSKGYPKLLIYFERIISDEDKILKEIKESIIFGQSIPDSGSKYGEQPVFKFTSLKGNKTNIYNGGIKLNPPKYYRFIFIIYG